MFFGENTFVICLLPVFQSASLPGNLQFPKTSTVCLDMTKETENNEAYTVLQFALTAIWSVDFTLSSPYLLKLCRNPCFARDTTAHKLSKTLVNSAPLPPADIETLNGFGLPLQWKLMDPPLSKRSLIDKLPLIMIQL